MISKPISFNKQKGASFYSLLVIFVLVGVLMTAALKLAPAYLDHNVLMSTIKNVMSEPDFPDMSIREVREKVGRSLRVNNVDFDTGRISNVKEGREEYLDVHYETRIHLFYNIDAVLTFDDRLEK